MAEGDLRKQLLLDRIQELHTAVYLSWPEMGEPVRTKVSDFVGLAHGAILIEGAEVLKMMQADG